MLCGSRPCRSTGSADNCISAGHDIFAANGERKSHLRDSYHANSQGAQCDIDPVDKPYEANPEKLFEANAEPICGVGSFDELFCMVAAMSGSACAVRGRCLAYARIDHLGFVHAAVISGLVWEATCCFMLVAGSALGFWEV